MRIAAIVLGILLIAAGAVVSAGGYHYDSEQEVLKVGDASLTVKQQKTPPATVGYGLLAAGALVLVIAALRKP